ncbi:MAG TPA: TonB C-terminal domain-containing protein [Gemmatimonadales bacterium]|nr:TonB C-terminal domain-containing protein [Gemmatimonadales bacterium]
MRGLRERAAEERLRGPGIAGSAALHALVVATFLVAGSGRHRPPLPPFYRVSLVAPPGVSAPAATPTPVAPAPAKSAPAPSTRHPTPSVSRRPAVPLARTPAAPKPQAAAPASPATHNPPPATSPSQPAGIPGGTPGGTDVATIKTEGVEFPFPGYLQNLVSQVYRRWRPAPSNASLQAEVFFFVHRDGSVTGLQFIKRSGSFAFDLEAQGAIEAAARAGALGQLPTGYGPDVLPVSFYFNPRSVR